MKVEAPIVPKEQLSKTDFQVLECFANNLTHKEIRRQLVLHKKHLAFVERQIARKMGEPQETMEGVCKAMAWAVTTSILVPSRIPDSSRFSSLDEADLRLFELMSRGLTKFRIAQIFNCDSEEVVRRRKRVSNKLGLNTVYTTVALAAYGLKKIRV